MNDYAIPVDPEGDTTWDATSYIEQMRESHPSWAKTTLERGKDYDDILREDPNAPEWIREWRGPFDTYLSERP